MKFLSQIDSKGWLEQRGMIIDEDSLKVKPSARYSRTSYYLPSTASHLTALSLNLLSLTSISEGLLWVTNWQIFTDNIDLFLGYRSSLGESGSLKDKPGHLFFKDEYEKTSTLLNICLLYSWDGLVIDSSMNTLFEFSHDERLDIYFASDPFSTEVSRFLSRFGLKEIE